jgi:hypothetical protein
LFRREAKYQFRSNSIYKGSPNVSFSGRSFSTASTRYGHRLPRLRFVRDFSFAFADADAPEHECSDCSSLDGCRSDKEVGRSTACKRSASLSEFAGDHFREFHYRPRKDDVAVGSFSGIAPSCVGICFVLASTLLIESTSL